MLSPHVARLPLLDTAEARDPCGSDDVTSEIFSHVQGPEMRMMTWREMLAGVTGRGDSRVSSWVHIITAVFTPTDRPLPIAVHASGADAVDPAARRPRARLDSLHLSSDDDSSMDGSWP